MSVFKIKEGYESIHEGLFGKKKETTYGGGLSKEDFMKKQKIKNTENKLREKRDELRRLTSSNPNDPRISTIKSEIETLEEEMEKMEK